MDPQSIPLPFPVTVQYWICHDDESRQKVKVCALHPVQQWIITADKTSVCVWDYFRQQCIMEKTLAEILSYTDKANAHRHHNSSSSHQFISSRSYQSNSLRSNGYHQYGALTRKFAMGGDELATPTLKAKDIGDIKKVSFADRVAIQWNCGGIYTPPTSDSFHTTSRVMIECDAAVVFFDFAQQSQSYVITAADLGKYNPTCAEFVFPELCAVGCSDGNIRVWDCLNWKLVKVLSAMTRSEVVTLKNIIPRSVSPGGRECDKLAQKDVIREGRMRFLSIAYDGSGFLWEGNITGNIIEISGSDPTGHFLSQGSMAQYLDEPSDTLFTVSADRTIRIWDLSSIKKTSGGTGNGKVRSGRRASLSAMSATSHAGSENGRISCVGKVKTGTTLPSSLAKFSHISALEHPRYPVGTFIVSSKTNSIGIVQIQDSSSDALSEKSSVRSSSDSSLRLVVLHDISLAQLMASHAAAAAANSPGPGGANVFSQKWLASRDPSAKVYSAHPHPSEPGVLVVASSIGIVVLSLGLPQNSLIGAHRSWEGSVFSFSDKMIKCTKYLMDKNKDSNAGTEGTTPFASSPATPRRSLSLLQGVSRRSINKTGVKLQAVADEYVSNGHAEGNNTPAFRIIETEELCVSADCSSVVNPAIVVNPTKKSGKWDALTLATTTCRPQFRPSPSGTVNDSLLLINSFCVYSGNFCAVFWPESLYFVVYSVSLNVAVGGSGLKEVDCGQCYSLAWVSSTVGGEEYCIITSPNKRIDGSKKKKFTIFGQRDQNPEGCLPSLVVVKRFSGDYIPTDSVCSGGPDAVEELFGGSVLLCITSPSKASESAVSDEKRAISQIEAEAIAAQSADDKPPIGVGADIPLHMTYVSQFYYLRIQSLSGDHANASSLNPVLEPVGPLMSRVSDVSFDTVRKCTASSGSYQIVAVLIASKVNILSAEYRLENGKMSLQLQCLSTVEIPCSVTIPSNLRWWNSVLFVCNSHSVQAVTVSSTSGGHGNTSVKHICHALVSAARSDKQSVPRSNPWHSRSIDTYVGFLEKTYSDVVAVDAGYAFLSSLDGNVTPCSLLAHPVSGVSLNYAMNGKLINLAFSDFENSGIPVHCRNYANYLTEKWKGTGNGGTTNDETDLAEREIEVFFFSFDASKCPHIFRGKKSKVWQFLRLSKGVFPLQCTHQRCKNRGGITAVDFGSVVVGIEWMCATNYVKG